MKRRLTSVLTPTLSAVAMTLVALAYVTEVVPRTGVFAESPSHKGNAFRGKLRERLAQSMRPPYSLLLDDLDVTPTKKQALMSFLMDEDIGARLTTPNGRGKFDEHERSNRIADIIGDTKAKQFLAREHTDLFLYGEALRIGSLLERNGVPLTGAQGDELFSVLVEAQDLADTLPTSDTERGSIEQLEDILLKKDEFERHVLELGPTVLSAEQVGFLFEQYQYLSYERANALQDQKRQMADPTTEDVPGWYPAWTE